MQIRFCYQEFIHHIRIAKFMFPKTYLKIIWWRGYLENANNIF
jgi:hypothetical protein